MTSYCQYTPDKKEQSTQNQTKICAIIVFYVYFVLYIELLFGDVGLNGSLNGKKVPTIGIENIFTGNPFAVIADSGGLATVGGTKWEQDNGGYHVEDIKYPAGGSVSLTVSMTLPANSIVIVDVNTLNGENIDVQGSLIRSNFTSSPEIWNLSIRFTGRTNQILSDIRYMPLVIHLG